MNSIQSEFSAILEFVAIFQENRVGFEFLI